MLGVSDQEMFFSDKIWSSLELKYVSECRIFFFRLLFCQRL